MDFAPAPARGEGGWRADRSGGGWGADRAPLTVRIRVPGRFENQPTGIVRTEKDAFTEVAARTVPVCRAHRRSNRSLRPHATQPNQARPSGEAIVLDFVQPRLVGSKKRSVLRNFLSQPARS